MAKKALDAQIAGEEHMTNEDWENIWDEFDSQLDTIDDEIQEEEIKERGEGYYATYEHLHWLMEKKLIRRLVEAKLQEKIHEHRSHETGIS